MTALILFTRELAKELRVAADDLGSSPNYSTDFVLRRIADAIDAAAKRAFHL